MKRIISDNKQDYPLDLLVVGGGIHGAAMAYYAGLNNLKTSLVEQDDFCIHTSANSQKVIHGGLRYLQTFDIKRVIESIRERQRFYTLFPHLVQPLPCVLPLSGWGGKSKGAMRGAFILYRLLQKMVCRKGFSAHIDKQPYIISASKILKMFPYLDIKKLRGGALWYDGICLEPGRVVLSLLKSAANHGVNVANYAKLQKIERISDSILSVSIQDRLTGRHYSIKTKKIALCTGPWLKDSYGLQQIPEELDRLCLIAGVNSVAKKLTDSGTSIALRPKKTTQSGLLFVVPWKNHSIYGTLWRDGGKSPDFTENSEKIAQTLHSDVHSCYQSSAKPPPVLQHYFGYVPGDGDVSKAPSDRILSHYLLVDRECRAKSCDVLQVVGVKFTTAFDVGYKALVTLFPKHCLNNQVIPDSLPVGSSSITRSDYLKPIIKQYSEQVSASKILKIYSLVGTELLYIMEEYLLPRISKNNTLLSEEDLLKGLTCFFVHEEMAVSLVDIVIHRFYPALTDLLSEQMVGVIGKEMAEIFDWTPLQLKKEIEELSSTFVLWYT